MSAEFKPMLAEAAEIEDIKLPCYVSPKLDGIRAIVKGGRLLSRALKPIPNRATQVWVACNADVLEGMDGELICGAPTDPACFNRSTSAVMSEYGPLATFYVFDYCDTDPAMPFTERYALLSKAVDTYKMKDLILVPHSMCSTREELILAEELAVAQGYEGVMTRSPGGPYKHGRSTLREGWLLKLKRFEDSEGEIIEVIEQMANGNAAKKNALGNTERSSHKANLMPKGTMGAVVIRDVKHGWEVAVGTGFDDATRAWYWANREAVKGKLLKYRYQTAGMKDLPRFPSYVGLRDERDV